MNGVNGFGLKDGRIDRFCGPMHTLPAREITHHDGRLRTRSYRYDTDVAKSDEVIDDEDEPSNQSNQSIDLIHLSDRFITWTPDNTQHNTQRVRAPGWLAGWPVNFCLGTPPPCLQHHHHGATTNGNVNCHHPFPSSWWCCCPPPSFPLQAPAPTTSAPSRIHGISGSIGWRSDRCSRPPGPPSSSHPPMTCVRTPYPYLNQGRPT